MNGCLHPKLIPNPVYGRYLAKSGKPVPLEVSRKLYVEVPCGHCVNCLSSRQNTWAWRIEQEAFDTLNKDGAVYFLTITYDDQNLIYGVDDVPTLYKKDLQDFHKRLRASGIVFRYFDCGEYGDRFSRPHYHGIYFFPEWMTKDEVHQLFFDKWRKCEDYEFHVDNFSLASAKYVAKYSMKRFGVNYDGVQPPFSMMSLKPAIGSCFLDNKQEIERLKDMQSITVYDSSGQPYALPRCFREKIFTPFELQRIYNQLEADERCMDVLKFGTSDDLDICRLKNIGYIRALDLERSKVSERWLKQIGQDCRIDYESYLGSI